MKQSEKPIPLEDVELVPDAMERLEGAIKHAARKPAADHATGPRRTAPTNPKERPLSKETLKKSRKRAPRRSKPLIFHAPESATPNFSEFPSAASLCENVRRWRGLRTNFYGTGLAGRTTASICV